MPKTKRIDVINHFVREQLVAGLTGVNFVYQYSVIRDPVYERVLVCLHSF